MNGAGDGATRAAGDISGDAAGVEGRGVTRAVTRGASSGATRGVTWGVTCLGEALAVLVPAAELDHTPERMNSAGHRPSAEGSGAGAGARAGAPGLDQSVPTNPDPLAPAYAAVVGGAEANTACALAGLGIPARWVGRVGDDRFGRLVLDTLRARGVDVSAVEIDPERVTGLYVKEINPAGTRMRYYRAGSAACAMTPAMAAAPALADAPVLHLSGITPALSESCYALIRALLAAPRAGRVISFDVNWRPALWQGRDPALLLDLARRADLVFVGADEAAAAWGADNPAAVRALLPEPATLIVKQGAEGVLAFHADGSTVFAAAPPVEVVEATGAGDAFAAGYLAGLVRGLPPDRRMALGSLAAGAVLQVRGDHAAMPAPHEVATALEYDLDTWLAGFEPRPPAATRAAATAPSATAPTAPAPSTRAAGSDDVNGAVGADRAVAAALPPLAAEGRP